MTTTSKIRTSTRIGLLAMALTIGAGALSPASARGDAGGGGGAGNNPMQIVQAQNIALPAPPAPPIGRARPSKPCGYSNTVMTVGAHCGMSVAGR